MKRVAIIFFVAVVTLAAIAVVLRTQEWRSISSQWGDRFAAAREAGDCQATLALMLGGMAASHLDAWRGHADLAEANECGLEADHFTAEFLTVADIIERHQPPHWWTHGPAFSGRVIAGQVGVAFRGRDPIRYGMIKRWEHDCSYHAFLYEGPVNVELLRNVVEAEELSIDRSLEVISVHDSNCKSAIWAMVDRAHALERPEWTPTTCHALYWVRLTLNDPEAVYRYATECADEEQALPGVRVERPPSGDHYFEANSELRAAAAAGHVLAAREYALRTRSFVEEREAAEGSLPIHMDPTWIGYLYARRAIDREAADNELLTFFADRINVDCLRLANDVYAQLDSAWSGGNADWPASVSAARAARICGPYAAYDDRTFDEQDWFRGIPEFQSYSEQEYFMGFKLSSLRSQ